MQSAHVSIDDATDLCLKSNYSHFARVVQFTASLEERILPYVSPLNIFILKSEMYLVTIRDSYRCIILSAS